jgi:hypothetical protein
MEKEKYMKHYLVLVLLLIAAIGFYIAGSVASSLLLIGAGAIFELTFWFGLLKPHRKPA